MSYIFSLSLEEPKRNHFNPPSMDAKRILLFSLTFLSLLYFSASFLPTNNFLVNCGSNANTSFYNRIFLADSAKPGSLFLSAERSVSLTDRSPSPNTPILYHTARVFTTDSSYKFNIKKNGTGIHLVRLHFSPFQAQNFNLASAKFNVVANGFLLLSGFSANSVLLKEYLLEIDGNVLEIMFSPVGDSGFAFVNGIEVFSVPKDFIIDDGARSVIANGIEEYKNLTSRVLETVHRINVGGSKLTPFNDTLWRTWIPDDGFLVFKPAAKRAVSTHLPNYQSGGATREIAPDNVYMSAQQMNRDNSSLNGRFNITWDFPVGSQGAPHLVRLHFCDIVSPALNQLYFDVYINNYSAYRDLDLSMLTYHVLSSPVYIDFVADSDDSGVIRISVGPSDLSTPSKINAILNGVEIMRLVNLKGSHVGSNKKNVWILVGSIVGGIVIFCLAAVAIVLAFKCKKKKPKPPRRAESAGWTPLRVYGGSSYSRMSEGTVTTSPGPNGYHSLRIPFVDIQTATNNFDKSLIIGMGGFGMVYKGVLRDNTKVAVKRGVPGSRQGLPEFQTEITVLSKIRHRHLVSLVGYCEEQSEMILVYEYMEKGPLKNHLYCSKHPPLSWKQRLEICIGSARGLHYLHTGSAQGIIHRDIKSTNILLDENFVAKVADFGLSRSGPCLNETHVSTGVKGSFGYLDPEYFRRQQLTDKSDVYSFGVVLFEVLCARPAVDPLLTREQVNLAEWAMQWQKKGMLGKIIDPHLVGQIKPCCLKKYGETAEKCLAEYGVDRPTMGDVLWNLEYALQLQESGPEEPREGSNMNGMDCPTTSITPSSNARTEKDDGSVSSDITTSQVFSQLMTKEGR
ncbi:PREDICTED: probable receptor-like protein kinase At5g24010 [Theobroma cacao]|uniref:Probable receptor-like protein kinase At5g24010 n=1 Tax=Theobroma cacao TaxID=3641 RepID=A0AB32VF02_THECC|nr:PREDICTED: probable receptor-like protein kinase At5g24010 [Theobroma cacao]